MNKTLAILGTSVALLAACGSSKSSSAGAASPAFCASAKALGSLTKGTGDAMAMSPADSMKDFEALSTKIAALKTGAPADLAAAIDTVVARLTLEAKAEGMMAADPNSASNETKMLADHKADDDAATAKLVAGVKSACSVDIA